MEVVVVATMVNGGRGSKTQAMVYSDIRFAKSALRMGSGNGRTGASDGGSGPATAGYRMTNARLRIKYRLATSLVTAISPSFLLLLFLLWGIPSILLAL